MLAIINVAYQGNSHGYFVSLYCMATFWCKFSIWNWFQIYAVISISAVLLSIFTFCAETHPYFKSNMTAEHYAEVSIKKQ